MPRLDVASVPDTAVLADRKIKAWSCAVYDKALAHDVMSGILRRQRLAVIEAMALLWRTT